MSKWHDDCLGRGGKECIASTICAHQQHPHEDIYKRLMTVGPMRYGMRVGAVSPPPPGIGPRYRSHQSCWPTTPCGDSGCDNVPVSRIPLLTTPPINSVDIISCANRMRINEDATSNKLLAQQASVTVRDHVLYSNKCLLKTQLKRCALVRPQVYTRFATYGEITDKDDNTLDRLPRFRFGGNRTSAADKRNNDHRYKELSDRLKRGTTPVPPPRTRHSSKITPPLSNASPADFHDNLERHVPLRSASFSQVDYCPDDNKYIRRRPSTTHQENENENPVKEVSTLPRPKSASRPTTPTSVIKQELPVFNIDCTSQDIKSLNVLTEIPKDPEPEVTPSSPDKPTTRSQENNIQDKKRDKSRRRKGIYISQWPNTYQSTEDVIPQFVQDGDFPCADSTSKFIQESLVEISKLSNSDEKNKEFPIWSSPQEEPLSPEENNIPPEWPTLPRPRFLSQSPDEKETLRLTPRSINLFRSDSLSEGEPDFCKLDQISLVPSDLSDNESRLSVNTDTSPNVPRRYSKRPLRGPYGQMLEAEMKKPECRKNLNNELKFLEDLSSVPSSSLNNLSKSKHTRTRGLCNSSLDETNIKDKINNNSNLNSPKQLNKRKVSADNLIVPNEIDSKCIVNHQRTTSSPSKLEGFANVEVSCELLEQLLRGSSEQLATNDANQRLQKDTRTHVVVELYDNEKTYVESLRILVTKYLEPLKAPENANLLDANLVDEIFYQIPFLYNHHQIFLAELKERLEQWDVKQKIGDVFLEIFSKPVVIDSYTNYVNNWKKARETLKNAQQSKPAFSRFLEVTARQHTGKLALDSLLIKPIQKFPKYELLLQRLIKHTDEHHPDHNLLLAAQRQVHEQLLKINCTEKEALELEQLREIEGLIDGLIELATPERQYLRHDSVTMSHGVGPRKERALFLFSDLLLVTGIKRRSGTIRRPTTGQGSVTSTLEANKYKLLMKVPLEDIEIIRSKDDNLRQIMIEVDNLTEDISILNQINELTWSLHYNHTHLDEVVKEMLASLNKQLNEQQNSDSQLSCLDLTISTPNGPENVSIVFSKSEKRTSWEESLNEAKLKLATSSDRRPCPELLATVPIRKTRAGLQFTCAAPTLSDNGKDVWVCNSDGHVGQVCVLSLMQEPNVISCNGVCNARILCIASVPGVNNGSSPNRNNKVGEESEEHKTMHFDSSSSSDEDENCDSEISEEPQKLLDSETCSIENEETDIQQSTMWLGTEDGCIHVYNCSDNIRIKKNKIKIQLGASILSIIYLDNRVYVSLANGDIIVYDRDTAGIWNTTSSTTCTVGSLSAPITKMVPSNGKLWCGGGSSIKIFDVHSLTVENSFTVNNDNNKSITSIVLCGNGVWLSLQNSAVLKCYHVATFELLCEINVAPSVTKMLTSCDDIIRQHKAACLRVTALVTCKDLLWIGTSAGVLLTMPLPHLSTSTTKLTSVPTVTGVPHGHTGHVRFLTSVEMVVGETSHRNSYKTKQDSRCNTKLLVISGGDGYEDFRTSNISEVAGREDSTNHLLLWNI